MTQKKPVENRPDASSNSCLISETVEFWKNRSGMNVSPEEARVMIENVVSYFSLLARWDAAGSA